jgi:Na+/melibiose symporter-like transporter
VVAEGGAGDVAPSRRRKLGVLTKLAFASGSIEEAMVSAAGATTMVYYNQVLGVSPALCGTAFLIASIGDAISDPLVGAFSDQVRTRWGRRHPLMFLSAFPVAICFYLIYQPPAGLGEFGLFLWLAGALVAMGVVKDFYALPHNALGAELTDDYNERTSIFGWNSIVGAIAGIAIGVFVLAVLFPSTPEFDNGLLNRDRYQILALAGACVCFAAIMLCTFATADQIPYLHAKQSADKPVPRRYAQAFGETWINLKALATNRSYLAVCACWLVLAVSGGILGVVGAYGLLYGFAFTTEDLAITRFVTIPGILLCVPLSIYLTRKLDKKNTVALTIVISCLLVGLPYCLKLLGLFPPNNTPASLPTYFIIHTLAFIALPIVPIVINSQMVDVADEHELRTGHRAEGLIFSVRLFSIKATGGLGAMIAGFGLEIIGFPKDARAETLDPAVVDGLMFMMGPLYYLIVFSGLGLAMLYNIDRSRHADILAQLEARRARTGAMN